MYLISVRVCVMEKRAEKPLLFLSYVRLVFEVTGSSPE